MQRQEISTLLNLQQDADRWRADAESTLLKNDQEHKDKIERLEHDRTFLKELLKERTDNQQQYQASALLERSEIV